MNQYISEKIKVLSFASILLVLYIHSGFHADEIENMIWAQNIQIYISGILGRCAVPLFYVISGYLFFLSVPNGFHTIVQKIQKRIKTLFIPYLFSALFFVVLGVIIAKIPGTSKFMNSTVLPLFDKDWTVILISIFFDTGNGSPMAFQLWFLRDLLILIIFSPIWYYLFKFLKWYWLPLVFILNYSTNLPFPVYPLFWFAAGGSLVTIKFERKNTSLGIFLLLLFLVFGFLELYFQSKNWRYFQIPIISLGLCAIWLSFDKIISKKFSLKQHKIIAIACS